jgi:hypothetical protein
MVGLVRYQTAILLRSHRWIFPLIAYGLLVSAAAAMGAPLFLAGPVELAAKSTQLAQGLAWSAAMLVPVVAFLTRTMLTAEPGAARACVAAAVGPIRVQLAALLTALGGGAILGIAGACLTMLIGGLAATARAHPGILAAGLGTATVCLLVGSAVGTLCNPPLLRHPGVAVLATLALIVFALASDLSPAAAVLRWSTKAQVADAHWPGGVPLLTAAALLAVIWSASLYAGARRG